MQLKMNGILTCRTLLLCSVGLPVISVRMLNHGSIEQWEQHSSSLREWLYNMCNTHTHTHTHTTHTQEADSGSPLSIFSLEITRLCGQLALFWKCVGVWERSRPFIHAVFMDQYALCIHLFHVSHSPPWRSALQKIDEYLMLLLETSKNKT